MVRSYSMHWPCLVPQHGNGKKHHRPIVLTDDGCRVTNGVTVQGRSYAYPRYLFANESTDILGLCGWALDLLGVAWRLNRPNSLSVARRQAVAALDRWVGPTS